MKRLSNITMLICLMVFLAGCVGPMEKRSKEGYKKSPCACFDEYEILNGKIFKIEKV